MDFSPGTGVRGARVAARHVATFRRTCSSWSHDKGVPRKVIAQLMGHADVDTTLNVDTQVLDGAMRTAVDKIGDELFTDREEPAAPRRQILRERWRALPAFAPPKLRRGKSTGAPSRNSSRCPYTRAEADGAPCRTRTCDLLVRSLTWV